ncbi:hypothetical protein [uncultured Thiodictyon sp.]|uniref:hypothetical protein n=1 Tax=uncultured Thiodictyon sp. TaxID=1846217 RepID=UPI0025DBD211|nr:hypothetical protein [uncultured Thiodictyon sp.]
MTVRIGGIELTGVQDLRTEESRTLVENRVPEQQGSVFQDLGREPLTLVLEGLLFRPESLDDLERLREAQAKAQPLSFAADIAVGSELTDVIIEDLRVRQVAGYAHRYHFALRLREHRAPPAPAQAGLAAVDAQVSADAAAWGADSLAAAAVLQDPASLPGALSANPGLLDHLSAGDLADSIGGKLSGLTGTDLSGIMQSLGRIDPQTALDLLAAVRDGGNLGTFFDKYLDQGLDLLSDLTGVDLSKAGPFLKALAGGFEFLQRLKEVGESAARLVEDLAAFDPFAGLKPLLDELG